MPSTLSNPSLKSPRIADAWSIVALCLLYFIYQIFFTSYGVFSVDDFWFAHHIYKYKTSIPYRDFPPYKTVLGYYYLLTPMSLSHTLLKPLFYTKNTLAFTNAILLAVSSFWLKRFFSQRAVLASLTLLICAEFFLTYSTNIRADLLAYWLCLFSVLLLLEDKFILAGITIGVGFLISQKALWYIIANNFALGIYGLLLLRNWKMLKNILSFNLAIMLTVTIYIVFWSLLADFKTVLHSIFYEAYIISTLDWYNSARKLFWTATISYNPLPFFLWPCTFLSLFIVTKPDPGYARRIFIITYTTIIMLSIIFYKQPFPYYMVVTVPAFLVLYAAFFSWLFTLFKSETPHKTILIDKTGLWGLIFLYTVLLAYLVIFFNLSIVYLLISIIPIALGIFISDVPKKMFSGIRSLLLTLILLVTFLCGIILPLTKLSLTLPSQNGHYQQSMLYLTNALLQGESNFIAGIPLFYNKNQIIPEMQHLMGPAIDYLYNPSEKLHRVMLLASLNLTPITSDEIIQSVMKAKVKLYVNNYRMHGLPPKIRNYLASQYEHYWGSIYIYAPMLSSGQQQIEIKFSGKYQLESNSDVVIDNKKIVPGTVFQLTAGNHKSIATLPYRLKLVPENMQSFLDLNYQADAWEKMTN